MQRIRRIQALCHARELSSHEDISCVGCGRNTVWALGLLDASIHIIHIKGFTTHRQKWHGGGTSVTLTRIKSCPSRSITEIHDINHQELTTSPQACTDEHTYVGFLCESGLSAPSLGPSLERGTLFLDICVCKKTLDELKEHHAAAVVEAITVRDIFPEF